MKIIILGQARSFFTCEITKSADDVHLSMSIYAEWLLEGENVAHCKSHTTSLWISVDISRRHDDDYDLFVHIIKYRAL